MTLASVLPRLTGNRHKRMRHALVLLAGMVPFSLSATDMLVEADRLAESLQDPGVLVLDIQPAEQYQLFHIPGAVNAPYESWRTGEETPPEGMMPPVEQLEEKLGKLGIHAGTRVIIVATGASAGDMAAAARVFWTLSVMGHSNSAILNGGLIAYAEAGGKLERGVNQPKPAEFKARPDYRLVASLEDVQRGMKDGATLIDTRSVAEYLGVYQASPEQKAGTIPGAVNLPFDWLTINGTGRINEPKRLAALLKKHGIRGDGNNIHFCQSGNRASLNWFVDYAIFGNRQARLYDGSAQEWATRQDLPTRAEVDLW